MKIVVFGWTGFIGCGLVEGLASYGYEVTVGTRGAAFQACEQTYRMKQVKYDSVESVQEFIAGSDFVINCIANVHGEDMSLEGFRRVEVHLTEFIAQACLNAGVPLIQLSSVIAFGRKLPDTPIDETFVGSDFEMIDKVCIEREEKVRSVFQHSEDYLILRPVPIIGAKDKGGTLRKIFSLYQQGSFPIVEGGSASVTFADKRDIGNAVDLALRSFNRIKGKMYIIGGFDASWQRVKHALDLYYGMENKYASLSRSEAESMLGLRTAEFISSPRLYNDQRFRRETGYSPKYSLDDAIASYISG